MYNKQETKEKRQFSLYLIFEKHLEKIEKKEYLMYIYEIYHYPCKSI